jgi:uncharacterized protein YbaR (Trm112 family)
MLAVLACPRCKRALEVDSGEAVEFSAKCPGCDARLQTFVFPALARHRETGTAAAAVLDATDASCFYHPQKQAAQICDGCGRMICHLCSVDLSGRHLCPTCISSGKKKGKITTLENSRTRWDSIALSLAIFGVFLSIAAIILSPAAIYVAIRHWNDTGSLVTGRSKTKFVIAILIATATLIVYAGLLAVLIFLPHK